VADRRDLLHDLSIIRSDRPSLLVAAAQVLFYLATDQQGLQCYGAHEEFRAHPEWHLRLDNGSMYLRASPINSKAHTATHAPMYIKATACPRELYLF
jgi:hypothetical protein